MITVVNPRINHPQMVGLWHWVAHMNREILGPINCQVPNGGFLKCGYPQIIHFSLFSFRCSITKPIQLLGYPHDLGNRASHSPSRAAVGRCCRWHRANSLVTKWSRLFLCRQVPRLTPKDKQIDVEAMAHG